MYRKYIPLAGLFLLICLTGCNPGNGWELAWSDEFDYSGKPDPASWGHETGYVRNNELQYYTDRLENARVENGICTIQALLLARAAGQREAR